MIDVDLIEGDIDKSVMDIKINRKAMLDHLVTWLDKTRKAPTFNVESFKSRLAVYVRDLEIRFEDKKLKFVPRSGTDDIHNALRYGTLELAGHPDIDRLLSETFAVGLK